MHTHQHNIFADGFLISPERCFQVRVTWPAWCVLKLSLYFLEFRPPYSGGLFGLAQAKDFAVIMTIFPR